MSLSTAFANVTPVFSKNSKSTALPLCPSKQLKWSAAPCGKYANIVALRQAGKPSSRAPTPKRRRSGSGNVVRKADEKRGEVPFMDLDSKERLQKVLSRLGVASRRVAENMIMEGKVRVNGRMVKELGTSVDVWKDKIVVDGQRIGMDQSIVWIAFHKPPGYQSTMHSPKGLSRFLDEIPSQSLIPISPIEDDAAGLVVLTNERGVVSELSRPDHPHSKSWTVDCHGIITQHQLNLMTSGVEPKDGIGGVICADVIVIGSGNGLVSSKKYGPMTRLEVRIRDSRRRVITRLCEAANLSVIRMIRRSFGPVMLGRLRPGEHRKLIPKEVKALKRGVKEKNIMRG